MFDTGDPVHVKELHTVVLRDSYSNVLSNHKAFLVSALKGLIAFPIGEESNSAYLIYRYDTQFGFQEVVRFSDAPSLEDARGVNIGRYFYVCFEKAYKCMIWNGIL